VVIGMLTVDISGREVLGGKVQCWLQNCYYIER